MGYRRAAATAEKIPNGLFLALLRRDCRSAVARQNFLQELPGPLTQWSGYSLLPTGVELCPNRHRVKMPVDCLSNSRLNEIWSVAAPHVGEMR
jgi:hypothetical protein